MDPISGVNVSDAAAVAVELKTRDQMKALQEGMIKLIEDAASAGRDFLPPDATFSTYA